MHKQILEEMLKLATASFGLIAALAWNEAIKEIVNVYVRPFFGQGSGLISLLIYAVFVTILAVLVAYNLTKLIKK